ncbi:hypothetical protein [Streptomyces sp. NPDC015125]|uniref:hypothetical protein n=1 Tax=Streptomyces sp. NPDC015125 TaxID=3364938 RepID=UPI00370055F8
MSKTHAPALTTTATVQAGVIAVLAAALTTIGTSLTARFRVAGGHPTPETPTDTADLNSFRHDPAPRTTGTV